MPFCPARRVVPALPVAPISSMLDAFSLIDLMRSVPSRPETLTLTWDWGVTAHDAHRFVGTSDPDDVFGVLEWVAGSIPPYFVQPSVVLATIRPSPPGPDASTVSVLEAGDGDRWIRLRDQAAADHVELVEWFVFGDQRADLPRSLVGDEPRW